MMAVDGIRGCGFFRGRGESWFVEAVGVRR